MADNPSGESPIVDQSRIEGVNQRLENANIQAKSDEQEKPTHVGPVYKYERDGKKFVSVVGVELDVNEHGVGTAFSEEEFESFNFDEKSIEMLKMVAVSVKLDHPLLVEGPPDIGKTKAIEYVSFLTNNKLVRINCSVGTSPDNFLGRYVPNNITPQMRFQRALEHSDFTQDSKDQLTKMISAGRLLKADDYNIIADNESENPKLAPRTKETLKAIATKGEGLHRDDMEKIAQIEGLDFFGKLDWVWQDGELIKAMEGNQGKGYWYYIDETNAAEPAALVSLNRILETTSGNRRIELSENSGRWVEAGKNFRLLMSQNPPDRDVRKPLTPDFVRRTFYQKVGPAKTEDYYSRAMSNWGLETEESQLYELPIYPVGDRSWYDFRSKDNQSTTSEVAMTLSAFITQLRDNQDSLTLDQPQKVTFTM
ncbi:MAG: AAA family ATPase, partial [Candidatus Magasanikbacteria bacterium]|nr:AAA family ATPase [Candidatus Magasanikbacteria bacterium]